MSCAVGLTMVVVSSRCPFAPPLFMTPKMVIDHFRVYKSSVMQIRSCHARLDSLLVIFASRDPCVPPLVMTPKMDNVHFCVYIHSVMQIRSCHAQSDVCCSSSPLSAHVFHHFLWHQKGSMTPFVFILIPWCNSVIPIQWFVNLWSLSSRTPGAREIP